MPAAHVADGSMHWGVHGVPRPVPVILCELCVLILPTTNPKYGIDPLPAPRTKDRGTSSMMTGLTRADDFIGRVSCVLALESNSLGVLPPCGKIRRMWPGIYTAR